MGCPSEIFVTTHDAARLWRVLEVFRDPSYAPLTAFLVGELQRAAIARSFLGDTARK